MNTHTDKTQNNKRQSAASGISIAENMNGSLLHFVDNRLETVVQQKLQEAADNSKQAKETTQLQTLVDQYAPRVDHLTQLSSGAPTVIQRRLQGGMTVIGKYAISLRGGKLYKILSVELEDYDEADRPIPDPSVSGVLLYELQDAADSSADTIKVESSTEEYENAIDLPFLNDYIDATLGPQIGGESSEKDVFLLADFPNQVIGISKLAEDALIRITEEAVMLGMLANRKIPVVAIDGITTHSNKPALIMNRYAEGSKATVTNDKSNFNKPMRVGDSKHLNAKSITDLNKIMKQCQREKVRIDDIQFLIGSDGSVVIADPLSLEAGNRPPSSNMIQMIMRLMEAAAENVLFTYFQAHDGQEFTRNDLNVMLLSLKVDKYSLDAIFKGFMRRFGGVIKYDSESEKYRYDSIDDVD